MRRTTTSSSTASSASTSRAGGSRSTRPNATTGHLRLGHSRLPLARGTLDVGGPQVVHEAWGVPCTVELGQAVVPVSEANTGTATTVKAQEAQAYVRTSKSTAQTQRGPSCHPKRTRAIELACEEMEGAGKRVSRTQCARASPCQAPETPGHCPCRPPPARSAAGSACPHPHPWMTTG